MATNDATPAVVGDLRAVEEVVGKAGKLALHQRFLAGENER
jgi:hypothetical protein